MSRPAWNVSVKVQLCNGQQGCVELSAADLITFAEVQAVLNRASHMAGQLKIEPQEQQFRPKVVGQ
jgi:hypothetical protein